MVESLSPRQLDAKLEDATTAEEAPRTNHTCVTAQSVEDVPVETTETTPRHYGYSQISGGFAHLGDTFSTVSSSSRVGGRVKVDFQDGHDPGAIRQVMQYLTDMNIEGEVVISVGRGAQNGQSETKTSSESLDDTPQNQSDSEIPLSKVTSRQNQNEASAPVMLDRYLDDSADYAAFVKQAEDEAKTSDYPVDEPLPQRSPTHLAATLASYGTLESLSHCESTTSTCAPSDDGRRQCEQEILVWSSSLGKTYQTVAILDTGARGLHPNLASRRFIEEDLQLHASDQQEVNIQLPGGNVVTTSGRIELKFWPLSFDPDTNRLRKETPVRLWFNIVDDTMQHDDRPIFEGDLLLGTGYCRYMAQKGFSLYTMSFVVRKESGQSQQVQAVRQRREHLRQQARLENGNNLPTSPLAIPPATAANLTLAQTATSCNGGQSPTATSVASQWSQPPLATTTTSATSLSNQQSLTSGPQTASSGSQPASSKPQPQAPPKHRWYKRLVGR